MGYPMAVGKAILYGMDNKKSWLPPWQFYIGLAVAYIVIGALYGIPKWQADHFRSLISSTQRENVVAEPLKAKELFEIENEARKTLAQIFGGLFVLIGIYLAFRRQTVAEETLRVTERGQITDRFTKAIEQLGKTELQLQLGAIYALEKIAHDSPDYHWQVMEVLTAYVRDKYPWKEGVEPKRGDAVPLDLEAIMTVLLRRKHEREIEGQTINLFKTDLRNVDFRHATLRKAMFSHANLQRARFELADLQDAHFFNANLKSANFEKANLQSAHFEMANLQWAQFTMAFLQKARFNQANLQEARFEVANLDETLGLTQGQIDTAMFDEKTILPEGLNNFKALENWKKFQDWKKQQNSN